MRCACCSGAMTRPWRPWHDRRTAAPKPVASPRGKVPQAQGGHMTGGVLSPGTAALILFGIFFGLMLVRVPVAFALGLACVPMYFIEPRLDTQGLVQETFNAFNSFILLA